MSTSNRKIIRYRLWLLFALVLWVCIAGIDRLVWVNAGEGVKGQMQNAPMVLPGCEGRPVEYKGGTNTLEYRCSTIGSNPPLWPFQHTGNINPN